MRRLLVLVLLLSLVGCGSDDDGSRKTLTVYAAASLTASFEEIAQRFEAEHEGVDVRLSFGGSSDLATQILGGAPADVFASADTANMDKLVDDELAAAGPQGFATNTLEIVVPRGNPAGITTFEDLAEPGLNLVICAPEVPCGAASQQVADDVGVTLSPVSEEQSVTDVLAKVSSGEADAGLVYATDVQAAGDEVEGIPFPESAGVVNTYPIAPVAGSDEPDLAQLFIQLVRAETGQDILAELGFGPP